MACKDNGKANHPRDLDESHSDKGGHKDKKQKCDDGGSQISGSTIHNEMIKRKYKSKSSSSTSKSPHGDGGSLISGSIDYDEMNKNKNKLESSPSTSKSPHGDGGSQISGSTKFGSTTKELKYDSSKKDVALRVNLEVKDGEYNLKLTSVPTENTKTEHAQAAAMLMSQGELLRKLGEKLLSQLGMSYESEICRSLNLPLPY